MNKKNPSPNSNTQGPSHLRFIFTFLISLLLIETFFHFFGPKPQLTHLTAQSPSVAAEKIELPLSSLHTSGHDLSSFSLDEALYFCFNPQDDSIFGESSVPTLNRNNGEPIELISSPKGKVLLFADSSVNSFEQTAQSYTALGKWLAQANVSAEFLQERALYYWTPQSNLAKSFSIDASGTLNAEIDTNTQALAFYLDQGTAIPFALLHSSPSGPKLESLTKVLSVPQSLYSPQKNDLFSSTMDAEDLVVIENDFLQIAVDTKKGEIFEINLPFDSAATDHIRSVEVDRLLETSSHNQFPFFPSKSVSKQNALVDSTQKSGGYYPLLRRGSDFPGKLGALFNGSGESIDPTSYTLVEANAEKLVLAGQTSSRRIQKTFSLKKDLPHTFGITVEIEGDRSDVWMSSFALEAEANSSGVMEHIKYRTIPTESGSEETYNMSMPKSQKDLHDLNAKWVLHSNGFFGTILDPSFPISDLKLTKVAGEKVLSRYSLKDLPAGKSKPAKRFPWTQIQLKLPTDDSKAFVQVFAGPLSRDLLAQVDAKVNASNVSSGNPERIQYSSAVDFVGWFAFILRPFVSVMMRVLEMLHHWTQSWGLSLILFSFLIRGVLFPLNSWSTRKMLHNQKVQPQLQQLQKKYKKDPETLRKKTLEFYKKEGINPLSGCLPMLIQLPFLFAMLSLLRHTVQLRGVTLIPGWIEDLAAPDVIAQLPFTIPFLGNTLHLLPILLALFTYLQAKMSAPPIKGEDKESKEKAAQQQMMAWVSSAMFGFFFYSMPSGLNLYWLISILLGLAERAWIRRSTKA